MNFLEIFIKENLISEEGIIKQICPQYINNKEIGNSLQSQFIEHEDLEEFKVPNCTKEFDNEFLFNIFKALIIGGEFNQFDDSIVPYRNILKRIYKYIVK